MKSEKYVCYSICIVAAILCFVAGVAGYFIGAESCECRPVPVKGKVLLVYPDGSEHVVLAKMIGS